MKSESREKVTVSLDPGLLEAVDQEVRVHHAGSRSAVVEDALRLWRTEQQRLAIEQGVEGYYRSRSRRDVGEDRAWARFAGRQSMRLWDD